MISQFLYQCQWRFIATVFPASPPPSTWLSLWVNFFFVLHGTGPNTIKKMPPGTAEFSGHLLLPSSCRLEDYFFQVISPFIEVWSEGRGRYYNWEQQVKLVEGQFHAERITATAGNESGDWLDDGWEREHRWNHSISILFLTVSIYCHKFHLFMSTTPLGVMIWTIWRLLLSNNLVGSWLRVTTLT